MEDDRTSQSTHDGRVPFSELVEYIYDRVMNRNQNFIILICGPTGSGKSYAGMSLLEEWYERLGRKRWDVQKNIATSVEGFFRWLLAKFRGKRIRRKGDALLGDEWGKVQGNRDFQSKVNKAISIVLQTFRGLNFVLVFTVPTASMTDVHVRQLAHALIILDDEDQGTGKFYKIEPHSITSKPLYKFIKELEANEGAVWRKFVQFSLPSQENIEAYEKMKEDFIWSTCEEAQELVKAEATGGRLTVEQVLDFLRNVDNDLGLDPKTASKQLITNLAYTRIQAKNPSLRVSYVDVKAGVDVWLFEDHNKVFQVGRPRKDDDDAED